MKDNKSTLYLDWDGVIWDFKQAFCDWHGFKETDYKEWEFYEDLGLTRESFDVLLSRLPVEFWANSDYIADTAKSLISWSKEHFDEVLVLTVTGDDNACLAGKRKLARQLGLGVVGVVDADAKMRYTEGDIVKCLIDDKVSTVKKWNLKGGCAWLWPAEYNRGTDQTDFTVEIIFDGEPIERKEPLELTRQDRMVLGDIEKEGVTMKPTNPKDIAGSSKVPMNSMLSGAVMGEVALALFEGALKYGRHNYRKDGIRASVYYDAVGRHLSAWWEGEDIDEESGISHISKAMAGLHILRDCDIRGYCNDDRPPKTEDFIALLNERTKALIEKYPNPVDPVTEQESKKKG